MSQLLNSLLTVVGVLMMMVLISPLLALVALVTVPLSDHRDVRLIAKRSQAQFVAQWRHTGALNGQIEEAFTGHALVKVFGRQQEVEELFERGNEELYEASFGAQFLSGLIMPAIMFIGNLNYVAIAVVGGLRVASGIDVARRRAGVHPVLPPVHASRSPRSPRWPTCCSRASRRPSACSSCSTRRSRSPTRRARAAAGEPAGQVAFEHVSFRYEPRRAADRRPVARRRARARPSRSSGPTGAGKTTLVNLIMRFYELDAGRITLDGVDIATMPRDDLRGEIGMVLQDTWLFGGTIRDNIAYGRPGATEDEILAAAQATYVDRFVHALPDGYDTVIDEEGSNLSAGEKQLITIARAFLADPALLILDEATSSVDTRTEVLVQHAMAALRADRTSFVIAHRLSTIRDADLILVMERGRIVEQGTHAQLLARRAPTRALQRAVRRCCGRRAG